MVERFVYGLGDSKKKPDFFKNGIGLRAKEKRFNKAMEKFERWLKREDYLFKYQKPSNPEEDEYTSECGDDSVL